jgi:hypothetical protein
MRRLVNNSERMFRGMQELGSSMENLKQTIEETKKTNFSLNDFFCI